MTLPVSWGMVLRLGLMLMLVEVWAIGFCVGVSLMLALMKYACSLHADEAELA